MTGKQSVLEILQGFDTWCLCGCEECAKSENFIQALDSIEEVVKKVLGQKELLQPLNEWMEKTKHYGGTPDEYWKLFSSIEKENDLISKQLGRWESK